MLRKMTLALVPALAIGAAVMTSSKSKADAVAISKVQPVRLDASQDGEKVLAGWRGGFRHGGFRHGYRHGGHRHGFHRGYRGYRHFRHYRHYRHYRHFRGWGGYGYGGYGGFGGGFGGWGC